MSIMTQERVKDLFEYDNGVLRWRETRAANAQKGMVAGSRSVLTGRVGIKINKVAYQRGRLVYLMFHGDLPDRIIHVDGIQDNDKITNLKGTTHSDAIHGWSTNRINRVSKTSGVKCISWDKKNERWVIVDATNGKVKYVGSHKELSKAKEILETYTLEEMF